MVEEDIVMVLTNLKSIFCPKEDAFLHQASLRCFFWRYTQTLSATRAKNSSTQRIQAQVWKCIGQLLPVSRSKLSELSVIESQNRCQIALSVLSSIRGAEETGCLESYCRSFWATLPLLASLRVIWTLEETPKARPQSKSGETAFLKAGIQTLEFLKTVWVILTCSLY